MPNRLDSAQKSFVKPSAPKQVNDPFSGLKGLSSKDLGGLGRAVQKLLSVSPKLDLSRYGTPVGDDARALGQRLSAFTPLSTKKDAIDTAVTFLCDAKRSQADRSSVLQALAGALKPPGSSKVGVAPKSPPADPFVRALDGLSADKDIKKALLALEKTLSPLKAVGRYSPKASKEAYQAVADNPLMTLFAVEFLRDTRNSVADRTWVVKQLLPKLED